MRCWKPLGATGRREGLSGVIGRGAGLQTAGGGQGRRHRSMGLVARRLLCNSWVTVVGRPWSDSGGEEDNV